MKDLSKKMIIQNLSKEDVKDALIKLGTALGGDTLEDYSINYNPSIDKNVTEYTINIKVFKRY